MRNLSCNYVYIGSINVNEKYKSRETWFGENCTKEKLESVSITWAEGVYGVLLPVTFTSDLNHF